MGMFDNVSIYMPCPQCREWGMFALQTKNLECQLFHYHPLDEDWFTNLKEDLTGQKKLRSALPVFPTVPYDKAADVWENQAERKEILAMPSKGISEQLKYIIAYGKCPSCDCRLRGKIKIENGYLMQPLFDVKIENDKAIS